MDHEKDALDYSGIDAVNYHAKHSAWPKYDDLRDDLEERRLKREVERRRYNWLILATAACLASFWFGRAYERQAHDFDMACYPPTSQSESLLLWPGPDGKLLCQRRGKQS